MRNKLLMFILMICCVSYNGLTFAQSKEIQAGDIVEGQLTASETELHYTFSANQGDRISVSLSSRQFDTLLKIVDFNENQLIDNDDFEGSLNSRIDNFVIPATDDYTLIVTSSDGAGAGGFLLTFNMNQIETLAYGEQSTAAFDATTTAVNFQFVGKEGDIVSIQMTSDAIDSYVTLANEDYDLISDDNSAGGSNALIGAYTLPDSGVYYIRASTYTYQPVGEFEVGLDMIEPQSITLNEPISGHIANTPLFYELDTQVGDTISVLVNSEGGLLDTMMTLQSPYGYAFAVDDDGGYLYDPELNDLVITEPGRYVVIILPANRDTEGDFELTVIKKPATPIECNSSEDIDFNQKTLQIPFQMVVNEDQTITLTFTGDTNSLASLYTNFTIGGDYMYPDETRNDEQLSMSVTAPSDGQLGIVVSNYAYQVKSFRLDIDC